VDERRRAQGQMNGGSGGCAYMQREGRLAQASEREQACANESRPEPGRYREDGRGEIKIEDG
jgi:hypothetical protein